MKNLSPVNPSPSDPPVAENALATYGIILAVLLSIAALVVGFGKTNIFIILALSPMVIYFFHEFGHRLFFTRRSPDKNEPTTATFLSSFLLQDSPMLRLTLSLFILAIVAVLAKANIAPTIELGKQVSNGIISPLGQPNPY